MLQRTIYRCISLVVVLFLLFPASNAVAQSPSSDISIYTFNTSDSPVFDICYTLVGYSNTGCDENQDGAVVFADIPYGDYQVQASYPNGSDHEVAPFTITVNENSSTFSVIATTRGVTTVDVSIWTVDMAGEPVTDVCYQLDGYSQVGCDDNGDGAVLFQDIPFGNYLVVASYPEGSNHRVAPFHIDVSEAQADFLAQAEPRNDTSPKPGLIQDVTDVNLITRDPKTGEALTGACYELVGYSNIGCDENNDGRVSFEDIPFSSAYTIRQTTAPAGYDPIDDYVVSIMPMDIDGPVSILLVQSPTQAPKDRYNVSVVFYDVSTNRRVPNEENCSILRNNDGPLTLLGCDDGIVDGQVDFIDVGWDPEGNDRIAVSLACPYAVPAGAEHQMLWVGQNSFFLFVPVTNSGKPCT